MDETINGDQVKGYHANNDGNGKVNEGNTGAMMMNAIMGMMTETMRLKAMMEILMMTDTMRLTATM